MFNEKYPAKINVSFYPYTYVRVMAMKGMLYKKQDYDKLLKMQGNEIARYLEESEYKEEIHELAKEYEGYQLVEQALYTNFIKNIQKLQKISSPEMVYLVRAYIKKYDVYNLKTIIRAKAANISAEETSKLLIPMGILTKEKLLKLLEQNSLTSILKKAGFSEEDFKEQLAYYEKEKSLLEIENKIDQQYYAFLQKFMTHLAGEHRLFKEILQAEIDVMNVKLLLRAKKKLVESEKITSLFFKGGAAMSIAKLKILAELDFAGIEKALQATTFSKCIDEYKKELEEKDLRAFEKSLDVWLLQKATLLLHQFPLSVDTLLGYMIAKEIEMRNIRVLVKGKQFSLEEGFIEKQLVIV